MKRARVSCWAALAIFWLAVAVAIFALSRCQG